MLFFEVIQIMIVLKKILISDRLLLEQNLNEHASLQNLPLAILQNFSK